MQIVLIQNVPNLGRKNDIKNVKDGYFQNFLLPRKLAIAATLSAVQHAEAVRKNELVTQERVHEQAQEIKQKLEGLRVTLKAKSKGDKLYGSITEKEILKALEEKLNVRLGKEHLLLSEHIKTLGSHEISVRLMPDVTSMFILEVKSA